MNQILQDLIQSPAFWAAIVALLNALQAWLAPTIPSSVIAAVNGLIVVFAAAITGKQVAIVRAQRATKTCECPEAQGKADT